MTWGRRFSWCLALAGLALVVVGALEATVWSKGPGVVGVLRGNPGTPVVDTAPGVLRLAGPPVRVEVSGATGPVFLGIARAAEAESYLADVRWPRSSGSGTARR